MKPALIFLNGYYDLRYPDFYLQQLVEGKASHCPIICADGGFQLFRALEAYLVRGSGSGVRGPAEELLPFPDPGPRTPDPDPQTPVFPDVLIGDLDSAEVDVASLEGRGVRVVREWLGKTDKDYTDGQLAVAYAVEDYGCDALYIYGGLPRPDGYEIDHFLGNLKLMRFGRRLLALRGEADYAAEMRDPLQTVHFVTKRLRLKRQNAGLQRVSLIAEGERVVIADSENLRWPLRQFRVDPDSPNALRNEFVSGAAHAEITLARDSEPVYVIHNWYAE